MNEPDQVVGAQQISQPGDPAHTTEHAAHEKQEGHRLYTNALNWSINAALNSSGSQSTVRTIWSDFGQPAALFSFESTIEVRADLELSSLHALECIPMALHALERIPTA